MDAGRWRKPPTASPHGLKSRRLAAGGSPIRSGAAKQLSWGNGLGCSRYGVRLNSAGRGERILGIGVVLFVVFLIRGCVSQRDAE